MFMKLYENNKIFFNNENLAKGPLGLLALGDVGIRIWKKAKKEQSTKFKK